MVVVLAAGMRLRMRRGGMRRGCGMRGGGRMELRLRMRCRGSMLDHRGTGMILCRALCRLRMLLRSTGRLGRALLRLHLLGMRAIGGIALLRGFAGGIRALLLGVERLRALLVGTGAGVARRLLLRMRRCRALLCRGIGGEML
jgi:hypothetical protein